MYKKKQYEKHIIKKCPENSNREDGSKISNNRKLENTREENNSQEVNVPHSKNQIFS